MSNKILQINTNRNPITTEHVLELAIELNIQILAIQEPWVIDQTDSYRSINHSSYKQVFPEYSAFRPRVMFYILKEIRATLAPSSPKDPDCIIIDLTELSIQLINIYNATHPNIANSKPTIQRNNILPNQLLKETIILGDFNTHHPWWDPLRAQSSNAIYLLDLIKTYELELLNTPGEGTFYRPNMSTPSVIDLSFATKGVVNKIQDWQVLPDLGSDHFGVLFTICNPTPNWSKSNISRFNTKKANWNQFKDILTSSIVNLSLDQELDQLASSFTDIIVKAANFSIPKTTISVYSKPWWNENLKALGKVYKYFSRRAKRSNFTLYTEELNNAKNSYFNCIKEAKSTHWNQFLEKEDTQTIFKAMSYTKNTSNQPIPSIYNNIDKALKSSFSEKCDTFRTILFPTPPSSSLVSLENYQPSKSWKWPKLTKIELKEVCTSKIKGKSPGPDLITQEIIVQAYLAIPDTFYLVYSKLIDKGYHPKVWKQASGCILKKPNKPDYSQPKAYRVIALLNCLGKVSERILAKRLSYLAETTNLLHYSQIGSRIGKSAIDTALLLQNEVEVNRANKLKTSTLFLDVKGAFDHVSKNRLLEILVSLRLPISLIL